ncbi:hypothetical protein I3760_14G117700 [Carya illinoinensis]|nr:hypothetical protein I3760_14G117700 [Carya illinoinensis]
MNQNKIENVAPIIFNEEDCTRVSYPNDDALVATLLITNYTTHQILINNGSSANVLFWDVFWKMGLMQYKLSSAPSPLKGFSGEPIQLKGTIVLPVTTRSTPYSLMLMEDFLIVKAISSYKAILGRSMLNNKMKAITSTYHLQMIGYSLIR